MTDGATAQEPEQRRRAGNVTEVQPSYAPGPLRPSDRPTVIALPSVNPAVFADLVELRRTVKEAFGHGADLIELPDAVVTADAVGVCAEVGIGCIGATADAEAVDRLVSAGVTAVRWLGDTPMAGPDPDPQRERPRVLAARPEGLAAGDALVLPSSMPGDRDQLDRLDDGSIVVVDLTEIDDRAALAALVTVALEHGACGFITTRPSAVRRAAYAINAVEHAE